jgi:hypothetical protein
MVVRSRFAGNIFGQEASQSQSQSGGNKTFRQLNPKKFGKVMKCHNCQAVTHLAKDCPEANVTLIGEHEDIQELLKMNASVEQEGDKDYVLMFTNQSHVGLRTILGKMSDGLTVMTFHNFSKLLRIQLSECLVSSTL